MKNISIPLTDPFTYAHIDGKSPFKKSPDEKLPTIMGPNGNNGKSWWYEDSPSWGDGNLPGTWKFVAAAYLRSGDWQLLLDTCYFEFDNKARTLNLANPTRTDIFYSALSRWYDR